MKNGCCVVTRLSPPSRGLLHEKHEVRQQAAESRSVTRGQSQKSNLVVPHPEGKCNRETNDVKHRPLAANPVRHLAAAGSDGIMRGPQAVTEQGVCSRKSR